LLFVPADALGECVEGGVQQRDLVGDAGEIALRSARRRWSSMMARSAGLR